MVWKSAAALLLINNMAWAGTMGACAVGDVTVPCDLDAWDFGMQALHLRPDYPPYSFLVPQVSLPGTFLENSLDPVWAWGFKVEGSYHFRSGNDINLNWTHYSKITQQLLEAGASDLDVFTTEFKPKWDAVNLEFAQRMDFTANKRMRLHAGVQYGRVSHDYYAGFPGSSMGVPDRVSIKYNGVGPRVGSDFIYNLFGPLEASASIASALLVGQQSYYTATSGILASGGRAKSYRTALVPEFEGKLGLRYKFGRAQGNLYIEGGYLWEEYINAQQFRTFSGIVDTVNFALHGSYVGLKYIGYV